MGKKNIAHGGKKLFLFGVANDRYRPQAGMRAALARQLHGYCYRRTTQRRRPGEKQGGNGGDAT